MSTDITYDEHVEIENQKAKSIRELVKAMPKDLKSKPHPFTEEARYYWEGAFYEFSKHPESKEIEQTYQLCKTVSHLADVLDGIRLSIKDRDPSLSFFIEKQLTLCKQLLNVD